MPVCFSKGSAPCRPELGCLSALVSSLDDEHSVARPSNQPSDSRFKSSRHQTLTATHRAPFVAPYCHPPIVNSPALGTGLQHRSSPTRPACKQRPRLQHRSRWAHLDRQAASCASSTTGRPLDRTLAAQHRQVCHMANSIAPTPVVLFRPRTSSYRNPAATFAQQCTPCMMSILPVLGVIWQRRTADGWPVQTLAIAVPDRRRGPGYCLLCSR